MDSVKDVKSDVKRKDDVKSRFKREQKLKREQDLKRESENPDVERFETPHNSKFESPTGKRSREESEMPSVKKQKRSSPALSQVPWFDQEVIQLDIDSEDESFQMIYKTPSMSPRNSRETSSFPSSKFRLTHVLDSDDEGQDDAMFVPRSLPNRSQFTRTTTASKVDEDDD